MRHHFTVDVEEYYHPNSLERWIPRSEWDSLERSSPEVVHRLLDLLAEHDARGTFFVVGWLAEREPEMVRAIAAAGHEVASHGWSHRRVTELTPDDFRGRVRDTKRLLEDLTGQPVVGFRAPSFSIVAGCEWAFDALREEGYLYDSSLFPTAMHPGYGYPCPREPHTITRSGGDLLELPPTTLRLLGLNVPAAGGAYFRFFPYGVTRAALLDAERREVPGMFYVHPWELATDPPPLPVPWHVRLRIRGRSANPWSRIDRLLSDFRFWRIDETMKQIVRSA